MQTVSVICEYNPFHNGHLYHLNSIRKLYPNDTIVLVLSGNFTQRGDFSIIDKWTKVKIAKEMGISRSYVSRIETKAISKLSKEIKE